MTGYISTPDYYNDYICHYGVKGMRWGHRKARPVTIGKWAKRRNNFYKKTGQRIAKDVARSGRFYAKTGKAIAKSYVDRANNALNGAKTVGKGIKKNEQRVGNFYVKAGKSIAKPYVDKTKMIYTGAKALYKADKNAGMLPSDRYKNTLNGAKIVGNSVKKNTKKVGKFYANTGKNIAKSYVDKTNNVINGAKTIGKGISKPYVDKAKNMYNVGTGAVSVAKNEYEKRKKKR